MQEGWPTAGSKDEPWPRFTLGVACHGFCDGRCAGKEYLMKKQFLATLALAAMVAAEGAITQATARGEDTSTAS